MKTCWQTIALFCGLTLTSCLKDKTVPLSVANGDCDDIISYTNDVRPIIEASCKTGMGPGTGCHDSWIDEYDNIDNYIIAGTWQNEIFVEHTMPAIPNSFGIDSLTEEEFKTMQCWVAQGYPEN